MDDQTIMPFGKHKGMKVGEIPNSYWIYMYDRKLLKGELKAYAEKVVPVLAVQAKQSKRNKHE